MRNKRLFDLLLTVPVLMFLSPLFLVIAVWTRLDSSGLILFRQKRVGRNGKTFNVLKFRTMVVDAEQLGYKITTNGDSRITRSGRFLRKWKLDELPQLINVLRGEMSLVGPRPEVPEYVAYYPEDMKQEILSIPPGITDYAAIEYRNENDLLEHAENPQNIYLETILPAKLELYQKYVRNRSILIDISLILRTFKAILKSKIS